MKGKELDLMVTRCADIATKAKRTRSYILIREDPDGGIHWSRSGSVSSQLGLLEIVKEEIVNGTLRG